MAVDHSLLQSVISLVNGASTGCWNMFVVFDEVCASLHMEKIRRHERVTRSRSDCSGVMVSTIRFGRTPTNQSFEMMVDGFVAFAGPLP
jgi:hypothetical protein